MRWLGGERLFSVLQEAAPTGVRDADPAYWQLRLDALRMANRPDQFDEAAIDYCVTYEVSPPSWEPARCQVRVSGSNPGTTPPPLSVVSEVSTSFVESQHRPTTRRGADRQVELVGPAGRRHRLDAEQAGCRARPAAHRQRVVRAADPRRFHRRRRPAELGAGAPQREPRRAASSTPTGWWRCSSARWASTSTPRSRCAPSELRSGELRRGWRLKLGARPSC